MIKISKIGYQYFNLKGFEANRIYGSGDYLFLYFRCPTEVFINGNYRLIPENTYFLYQKGAPQIYRKLDGHYINDWIHFDIEPYHDFFETLGIPFQTPMVLPDNHIISEMISDLFTEYFENGDQHEIIMDQKASALFYKFSDLYHSATQTGSKMLKYRRDLLKIRRKIQNHEYFCGNAEEIAGLLNISTSYLQHIYKESFGISIQQDIIHARIEHAAYLLCTTNCSISEAAVMTGYENFEHFSRQFKKIMGCSPSHYRKNHS